MTTDNWATRTVRRGAFRALISDAKSFQFNLDKDGRVTDKNDRRNTGHISTATATVATEGEIRTRFTATRILAVGVFALAFKKKVSDKDVFLTINGDGFDFIVGPLKKDEKKARKFARDFNAVGADWVEFGDPLAKS